MVGWKRSCGCPRVCHGCCCRCCYQRPRCSTARCRRYDRRRQPHRLPRACRGLPARRSKRWEASGRRPQHGQYHCRHHCHYGRRRCRHRHCRRCRHRRPAQGGRPQSVRAALQYGRRCRRGHVAPEAQRHHQPPRPPQPPRLPRAVPCAASALGAAPSRQRRDPPGHKGLSFTRL